MPELPEVETVRSGLEKYILGKKITNAESFHPRAVKPGSIAPLAAVIGSKIKAVKRRGKFLWLELDRDFALVAHLGMSGQLLVQPASAALQSHLRAKLTLAGRFKSGSDQIRFRLGRVWTWQLPCSHYFCTSTIGISNIATIWLPSCIDGHMRR